MEIAKIERFHSRISEYLVQKLKFPKRFNIDTSIFAFIVI